MKNNLIMITLLSVTLYMGAFAGIRAPQAAWADLQFDNRVSTLYTQYVAARSAGSQSAGALDNSYLANLADSITANFTKSGINSYDRFDPMVAAFAYKLAVAADADLETVGANILYKQGALTTLGEFVGKMYQLLEPAAQGALNIRTAVALRNDGYYKEYFLDTPDLEKQTGLRYYFYSEPVQRPKGFLAMLGFGYTDKRSWGQYLTRKGLGLAAIGGTAALGYYGQKAYIGRNKPTEWEKQARETREGLSSIPGRVMGFFKGNMDANKESGYAFGDRDTARGISKRVSHYSPRNIAGRQEARENNRHEAFKLIKQVKENEKAALKDAREAKQGFFNKWIFGTKAQLNPEGSAFDIEAGNKVGTFARNKYLKIDQEKGLTAGTTEYQKNLEAQIKEKAALEKAEINRIFGTNYK